jgi:hypothetical protein
MKKIILLALALTFGFIPVLLSNSNTIETSIEYRKKSLCKTWYVAKAFEIRENKKRRDRTKQAGGSTFTFNKDYSFILTDKSRSSRKPMSGTWKETGKNSFSIIMKDVELNFEIKKLTKDSLYIVGSEKRMGNKKMHLVFSSSSIEPSNDHINEIREYEEVQMDEVIEIPEIEEEVVMGQGSKLDMPEPVEAITNSYDKEKLTQTWILTKCYIKNRDATEEYIGTSFVFGNDLSFTLIEFHKNNNIPKIGLWYFSNNSLEITHNNKTKTYKITRLTDNSLTIKEKINGYYSVYYFKSKK